MTIRPCRPDECASVLALWREAEATPSPTDNLAELARLLSAAEAVLLVAEEAGRIVGTIIGGWDGWRGNIYRLAVAPDCRRRGLGRTLVREAERRLVARGARRITALVERHDPWAVAFWDSLHDIGCERDGRMTRYVLTPQMASPTRPKE